MWVAHPVDGETIALLTGPAESVGLMSGELSWSAVPLTGSTRAIRAALASCSDTPTAAGGAPRPSSGAGSDEARIRSCLPPSTILTCAIRAKMAATSLMCSRLSSSGSSGLLMARKAWPPTPSANARIGRMCATQSSPWRSRASVPMRAYPSPISARRRSSPASQENGDRLAVDDIVGPAGGSWRESMQADMRRRRR